MFSTVNQMITPDVEGLGLEETVGQKVQNPYLKTPKRQKPETL